MSIWSKPSFYSLPITGILILIVFIIIITKYNDFSKINLTDYLIVLLLLSISIGIHGLLHLGLEVRYNFNPLE